MTDAEWSSWQANWAGATGPLPDVRARAAKEARSQRIGRIAFFLLCGVTLVSAIPAFQDREPVVHVIGWMVLAFFAAMLIGYLASHRGVDESRTGNPRDAVAFLERRLRAEQRMAQVVRWTYAALVVADFFIFPILVAHHERPQLEMAISYPWLALVLLVTFSAPWWVERRNRRHVEEIAEWRRWMDQQQL